MSLHGDTVRATFLINMNLRITRDRDYLSPGFQSNKIYQGNKWKMSFCVKKVLECVIGCLSWDWSEICWEFPSCFSVAKEDFV